MLLNEYIELQDFYSEGKFTYGDLMITDTGKLYGLTRGGINERSVLFQYNINDSLYPVITY